MSELTPRQRIERAHVKMMGHKSTLVYSSVLMVGEVHISDEVPTAYTNGRDVSYGSEFIRKLTGPELVGVILHENLHKAYQHHWLWKNLWKEDARLANMAADYVINCEIVGLHKRYPEFIKLPEGGLYEAQYEGMDTHQVFNALKQSGQGGRGFDEHDFGDLPLEVQEAVAKEIDQALRQGQMLAGKQGGEVSRGVEGLLAPSVDWREQLLEFMTEVSAGSDDTTWRKPNRRWIGFDMYMPSSVSESMGPLVVGIDTSGSISGELVSRFLSEIVGICAAVKPEVLHVLDVDAEVKQHRIFAQDDLHKVALLTEFKGGGGTDMCKIFDYITDHHLHPAAVVVLTDGYTPFPKSLPCKTLWAITTQLSAPVGVTVHLT